MISYEIQKKFVIFSTITGKQYKLLKNKWGIKSNGIENDGFKIILDSFLKENGTKNLKILIFYHLNNSKGDVVCVFPHKFLLPKGVTLLQKQF